MPTEEVEAPFIFDYEIDALVNWHRDRQYEAANKEDYILADEHRKRAIQLDDYKEKRKGK